METVKYQVVSVLVAVMMCGCIGCPFPGLSVTSHPQLWSLKEEGPLTGVMRKAMGDFPNIWDSTRDSLKGTGTPLFHLTLLHPSLFLTCCSSSSPSFGRKECQPLNVSGPKWLYCVWVLLFLPHEWLMPAMSDRNLLWTVKHDFVYCFACDVHKQSYSQLMFASGIFHTIKVPLANGLYSPWRIQIIRTEAVYL